MKQKPNEKELKELLSMAKDFEAQIREQSEIAREIAIEYEEALSKKQKKQAR